MSEFKDADLIYAEIVDDRTADKMVNDINSKIFDYNVSITKK